MPATISHNPYRGWRGVLWRGWYGWAWVLGWSRETGWYWKRTR